jgi:hypothetical protein
VSRDPASVNVLVAALGAYCSSVTLVGSRVTCNPAPTDTDQDILCRLRDDKINALIVKLEDTGWVSEGSKEYGSSTETRQGFDSYRKGDINLLITVDDDFHRRFLAATSVAKKLNLLEKADRIALFQAVLYGNPVEADPFEDIFK